MVLIITNSGQKHFVIGKEKMLDDLIGYVTPCGEKLICGGNSAIEVDPVWVLELENLCKSCSDYAIADEKIFEPIGVTER